MAVVRVVLLGVACMEVGRKVAVQQAEVASGAASGVGVVKVVQ